MSGIFFSLPFPPPVNHYWRHIQAGDYTRTLLSARGRQYKQICVSLAKRQFAGQATLSCPLAVSIRFFPPDRRKRDLDNLPKALLDSLTEAGVWNDDSLIRDLRMRWGAKSGAARAEVEIMKIMGEGQYSLLA